MNQREWNKGTVELKQKLNAGDITKEIYDREIDKLYNEFTSGLRTRHEENQKYQPVWFF